MTSISSLGSGLAGAAALNLVHEGIKRVVPAAPRMDLLGMQALSLLLQKVGKEKPSEKALYGLTLAGDVIANTLYYAFVGAKKPKNAWLKGAALGTAAGIGAVLLPDKLGLSKAPSSKTAQTSAMTVGLYVLGGLVAAGAFTWLSRRK